MSSEFTDLCDEWLARDWMAWSREEVEGWKRCGRVSSDGRGVENGEARLKGRLRFGTAGLRAKMGAGYDRLNSVTVVQATQGVVACLAAERKADETPRSVVIGYDGRHHSKEFARAAAGVFLSQGIACIFMSRPCPTPLVAFAVLRWECEAGIMITASHNPREDNGYKLYWGDGCQIRSPRDKVIAQKIRENEEMWRTDYADLFDQHASQGTLYMDKTDETISDYLADAHQHLKRLDANPEPNGVKIVYSAFHGVGGPYIMQMFERFGLSAPIPVPEQYEIDGDFPTLEFPNPEEGCGALRLSFETADRHGANIVLANDPDADRLAVAERHESGSGFRTFTGNEIAALLADWVWEKRRGGLAAEQYAMVASTVSSKFLRSMAEVEGFEFREALTGFKWLGHTALELKEQGDKEVLLTYEEAIGFLCGTGVLDKDGVSTAAVFAELCYALYGSGRSLAQRLEELGRKYGRHLTYNGYLRLPHGDILGNQFAGLRAAGLPQLFTDERGIEHRVDSVRDLTMGRDSGRPDGRSVLPKDNTTEFLTFRIRGVGAGEGREWDVEVTLRGSGTEAKVKFYSEVVCIGDGCGDSDGDADEAADADATLRAVVDAVISVCLEPAKNGLKRSMLEV